MSFLSILLVASAFYFAHARPDSQPYPDGIDEPDDSYLEAYHLPPSDEDEASEPLADAAGPGYQLNPQDFMHDMSETAERYNMMSKNDKEKKEELMDIGMHGLIARYINYWLLIIREIQNEKEKSSYGPPKDDSHYSSLEPYIPETEHDEAEVHEE